MFDFGFSEMLVVGVVALVVLGPERLPVVAKTAGEWVGKAQRFVAQVKSDITREAELSELKKLQEEAKSLADEVKGDVEKAAGSMEKQFAETKSEFSSAVKQLENTTLEAGDAAKQAAESATKMFESAAEAAETTSSEDLANIYGWGTPTTTESSAGAEPEKERVQTYFSKRYHSGPSVDELAAEVGKLRRELGLRDARLGGTALGNSRRMAPRSRSARPRIYR